MRANYIEVTTKQMFLRVLVEYKGRYVKRFAFQNLDLKKIDNYEDLINIEKTYIPGCYPLFDDFNFDLFTEEDLVFLTSVA